jgi:hypothetical protein
VIIMRFPVISRSCIKPEACDLQLRVRGMVEALGVVR